MADTEEPQLVTLADRIAALNKQKNFSAPAPTKRAPPPPPPSRPKHPSSTGADQQGSPATPSQPEAESRPPLPRRTPTNVSQDGVEPLPSSPPLAARNGATVAQPPALPSRRPSSQAGSAQPSPAQPSPALPPRRPSTQQLAARRGSSSSDMSHVSALSTTSDGQPTRRLPPTLDQANLPPLPPTRRELEAKAKEAAAREQQQQQQQQARSSIAANIHPPPPLSRPSLPPRLPSRPAARSPTVDQTDCPAPPVRRLPPPPASYTRPTEPVEVVSPPPLPRRPASPDGGPAPPPVPIASRPSAASITAATSAMCTSDQASCLVCRDFSGPDAVAAQHPAHSLPRGDPVGHLAHVLCGPFPSATDKARAIFTWCHHNIRYDVDSFFGQCVRPKAVNDTIFTGLAVCQGYAEVFCAVAQRAGLECVVISGHGKGFGHQPLPPGAPIPPQESNHAWNAVRIDGGRWKLVDACWGAGDVGDNRCYTKRFKPEMFFLDNALFGLKHYPTDSRRHFFLPPEVPIPSWAEYMRGPLPGGEEPAHFFTAAHEEGISEFSILPRARRIRVNSDETIRFRLTTVCDHYRGDVHGPGKPYVLLLQTHGLDGRKDQNLAFHVERDHGPGGAGRSWVLDVPARQLGAPGQTIVAMTLTKVNDRDARGWTRDMYLDRVGKPGSMAFGGLAAWDLV